MEQTNNNQTDARSEKTIIKKPVQTNAWVPATQRSRDGNLTTPALVEDLQPEEQQQSIGKTHAYRASYRGFQQASDRLKRANRDLGEIAAFIAASLTTVTAVEAVMNMAIDKLDLSKEILQAAFYAYLAIVLLILLWGASSTRSAIRRRSQAERDIDQAKKGIFEFYPGDQWPKLEE